MIDFNINSSHFKISPQTKLISIGSCFSEEIGNKLAKDKFDVTINPFGVIFHPIPIARLIQKAINKDYSTDIVANDDVFFSWDASGMFYEYNEEKLKEKFRSSMIVFGEQLQRANFLMVTFGTSYGYRHIHSQQIVSNCHKQPAHLFQKELSEIAEMKNEWNQTIQLLRSYNPNIQIILTVSPVKHIKDGIVENVRSKSRIIELCHQLEAQYFPSFEIVQEQLRDYSYYKVDGVHPNELAIDFVYREFLKSYLDDDSIAFQKDMEKYRTQKEHRLLYPESNQAKKFKEQLSDFENSLLRKYPFLSL